eukprot:CAMPEP_0175140716 /NCGR_PEP_ID=MMETSP0087-20121206/11680_1 /TAXON_ID=136419 /ORGANISM="Unknown Unknown, Strain D1" /LENGTH=719 /DNA_ID=CAMNT_0016424003 /DNA_START=11 /DNA_END=2170 /DNA_ORIENTATION=+
MSSDVLNLLKMPSLANLSLAETAKKFLDSESVYVERGLRGAVESFQNRLQIRRDLNDEVINEMEEMKIFQNIKNIYDFNRKMFDELMVVRMEGLSYFIEHLGGTMVKFIPFFRMYAHYIKNSRKSLEVLQVLKDSSKFKAFLTLNEKCAGSDLKSLLSTPVNRVPQYLAYLAALHSKVPANTAAAQALHQAISDLQAVADDISKKMKEDKARSQVMLIQKLTFSDDVALVAPHRLFVKKQTLKFISTEKSLFKKSVKEYTIWLFNDMLLIGHAESSMWKGSVKHIMRTEGLKVQELPPQAAENHENAFVITSALDKDRLQICACETSKDRDKWVRAIRTQVRNAESSLVGGDYIEAADDFEAKIRKKKVRRASAMILRPERRKSSVSSNPNLTPGVADRAPPPVPASQPGPVSQYSATNPPPPPNSPPPPDAIDIPRPAPALPETNVAEVQSVSAHSTNSKGAVVGDWKQVIYYENLNSGEVVWDPPVGFDPVPGPAAAPADVYPTALGNLTGMPDYGDISYGSSNNSRGPPPVPAPTKAPPAVFSPQTSTSQPPATPPYPAAPPPPPGTGFSPVSPQVQQTPPPVPPAVPPSIPVPPSAPPAPSPPAAPQLLSPPTAPSAPSPPPASPGGLLGQIQGGMTLRKVEASPRKASSSGGHGDLLAQIAAGKKLKKVEVQNQVAVESGTGLQATLAKSLMNYRKFVQADDEEESDDDDDEWD